jgi:hypothetical protein
MSREAGYGLDGQAGQVCAPGGQVSAPVGQVSAPAGQVSAPAGQLSEPAGQVSAPVGQVRHFVDCRHGGAYEGMVLCYIIPS